MVTAPEPSNYTQEGLKRRIENAFQRGDLSRQRGGHIKVSHYYDRVLGNVMQEYRDAGWKVEGKRGRGDRYTIKFSRRS